MFVCFSCLPLKWCFFSRGDFKHQRFCLESLLTQEKGGCLFVGSFLVMMGARLLDLGSRLVKFHRDLKHEFSPQMVVKSQGTSPYFRKIRVLSLVVHTVVIFWQCVFSGWPWFRSGWPESPGLVNYYFIWPDQVVGWFIWMFPKIVGFPPKSSILVRFSIVNHPFWGIPIFGNT